MLDPQLYRIIFDVIVFMFTIKIAVDYSSNSNEKLDKKKRSYIPALFVAIFMALFIGFRPLSYHFVDMVNYRQVYDKEANGYEDLSWDKENKIFDNIFNYMAVNQYDITFFFLIIACIYFLITFVAIKRFFPNNSLAGYVVWLGSFSTFSYGTNGIKAGAAAAFFLLALSYRDRKLWATILTLISIGFHHSMVVCGLAYLVAVFYKNPRTYILFWFFALLLSAFHITDIQFLLADISDEKAAQYLTNDDATVYSGKGGFRIDFVIYSAMPILVGYYALIRKRLKSPTYNLIFNVYVLVNSLWLLVMYASFTNRIAYLSWLMYPVVLCYPYLEMGWGPGRFKIFTKVAFGSLAFTLFMNYVYYG